MSSVLHLHISTCMACSSSPADLLSDLANFVLEVKFLYDFSNVRVMAEQRLDKMPKEWRELLHSRRPREILEALEGKQPMDGPGDFFARRNALLDRIAHLLVPPPASPAEALPRRTWKGMSPKKVQEVEALASLVHRVCSDSGTSAVVDAGCGLAHLERALDPSLRVLAVEANAGHCSGAARRLAGSGVCQTKVFHDVFDVEEEALPLKVSESLGPEKVVLVGLHCCGDLAPTLLRVLAKDSRLAAAVLVPCCYHRTKSQSNIVMSDKGREVMCNDGEVPFSYPALRLACQEPLETWMDMSDEELHERARFQGFRAVLEDFCQSRELTLTKRKRRCVRKSGVQSPEVYAEEVLEAYEFRTEEGGDQSCEDCDFKRKLSNALQSQVDRGFLEVLLNLTILQLSLQRLLEYVIILDRCLFASENKLSVQLFELFEAKVSPRNKVVVCSRE